jgi:anthranilate phosphoribosyltransferase
VTWFTAQAKGYCSQIRRVERERDEARKALREIASLDTSQDASPQQCGAVLVAMNALGL